jgi:outer membrane protein assembly factor BamB
MLYELKRNKIMKKWLKWTLGIIGTLIVIVVVYIAWNWTLFRIVSGTEDLRGESGAIPEVVVVENDSLLYGESDWISWYGPRGDRISQVTGIRTDWSKGLKKIWEVDYLCQGKGSAAWSSPVIQGNRLVVCGRDTKNDLIFCLNPKDGSLRWYQSYPARAKTNHGSGPRATPFIDQDKVYTFGRSGDLTCLSLLDGKILWRKNVTDEGGQEPTWGHSSSPLVLGDLVLVQGGGSCRTIAFDKNTGDVVWKSGNGLPGYAALKSVDLEGAEALLAFHGTGLAAITIDNGTELWNIDWPTEYDVNATTPVVIDDRVFITSGYGTGSLLLKVSSKRADSLWRTENFSSIHSDPYIIDGFIYGYSGDSYQNKGTFRCINLKSGKVQWSTNEIGWGTCVLIDEYLLCSDIKGNIFLINPKPDEFDLITSLSSALGDIRGPVWSTPVVSNGHLYLRFKQKLICYDIVG